MKNISLFLLLSILFSSCEAILMKPVPEQTPQAVFEQVWQFADKKYSFFDYKKINWVATKAKYQPLIKDKMSDEELFKVCADMLSELKDGHVNLKSDFDYGRNWSWYLDYPENFNYSFVERNYFKSKEQFLDAFVLYDFGDVLYIYYGDFMSTVSKEDMDYVVEKMKGKKGLIIDIRGNHGGSVANVSAIAGRFIDKKTKIGESWIKSGPNHESFTKSDEILEYNKSLKTNATSRIVLLTNRNCYSAANFFTLYMKALPQVTIVGDKTGGGGGIPAISDLSNGWKVRVSTTRTFDNAGFNIENGIDPHIKIDLLKADEDKGKDTILEKGLAILRK